MAELAMMLESMVVLKASDLYINVGAPPTFKVNGELRTVTEKPLDPDQIHKLITTVLDEEQKQRFEQNMELDIALQNKNGGRFRLNIYRQKGALALVARHIKDIIPSLDELQLPPVLKELSLLKQGLVLVVGGTGVGKSSTLASMIDYRNQQLYGHILTVEDPIEFVHYHRKSLVSQREIGVDTNSYSDALKYALREAPDVIVIGEIRDSDTARHALRFAETGHLCMATLHATTASSALDRFINFFAPEAQRQVHQDLAFHLKAVVAQRLANTLDKKRVPAVEVLINNSYISALIEKGDTTAVRQAMAKDSSDNCQTFDDAIYQLVVDGIISKEEANRVTDSKVDFGLRFRLTEQSQAVRYFMDKKEWLAPNIDLQGKLRVGLKAKRVNTDLQKNLTQMFSETLSKELRVKGYEVTADDPQLVLYFSYGILSSAPKIAATLEEFNEQMDQYVGAESKLALQVVDPETNAKVWTLSAVGPVDKQGFDGKLLQEEISNLLGSLPEYRAPEKLANA